MVPIHRIELNITTIVLQIWHHSLKHNGYTYTNSKHSTANVFIYLNCCLWNRTKPNKTQQTTDKMTN